MPINGNRQPSRWPSFESKRTIPARAYSGIAPAPSTRPSQGIFRHHRPRICKARIANRRGANKHLRIYRGLPHGVDEPADSIEQTLPLLVGVPQTPRVTHPSPAHRPASTHHQSSATCCRWGSCRAARAAAVSRARCRNCAARRSAAGWRGCRQRRRFSSSVTAKGLDVVMEMCAGRLHLPRRRARATSP